MILHIYCKFCHKPNKVEPTVSDRVQLSKEINSNVINLQCKHCLKTEKYNVNQVTAEKSKLNIVWVLLTFIFTFILVRFLFKYFDKGGIYSMYLIPVSLGIPSIIYFTWLKEESKSIKNFNRYKK